ncbi:polysaccharide pyruvyl transferase family protein [Candidatus Acetatifactor stercoripullorum]|uniref:polysaccharide pyruvyl transferase family protein n=1 Tax=Candidatus Acetatifactor stercoripullorum TaxID=2838414 RepID=UPI00298E5268|nr:polysaccharide pyruvyl transferase family protein [Candidatus Acetatifactor stercoripullorum]
MKIKLFFVHPKNYGNMMMAASFITYFTNILENKYRDLPEFYVDVLDDYELELVRKSLPAGIKVYRENLFNRKRRGVFGKLQKAVFIPYEIYYNIKNYDACVLLGGDCISQYYSRQVFISNMLKLHFIAKRNIVLAPGQTMGPFHGYAIRLVKWAMKDCFIYARDHDCYLYIKNNFDFENLFEARDLAALDIPYQNNRQIVQDTLNKYIGNREYITIVPSGANFQYTPDTEHYVEEYVKIIENTLEHTRFDVLLLAHVIHTNTSNDKVIVDQIADKISGRFKGRLTIIDSLILPYEARILLGNGQYTITGRMHAAVSSINMGVPAICLSYSVKYKGVIGDVYGMNDYILQCRGADAWQGDRVYTTIVEMQKELYKNKDRIQKALVEKNVNVKKLSLWQIEDIVDRIAQYVSDKNNEKAVRELMKNEKFR